MIAALFTPDAVRAFQPLETEPARGLDAVVARWLEKHRPARLVGPPELALTLESSTVPMGT